MVSCTKYDKNQDYAEFYADTVAELSNLPNLTDDGKAELQYMNRVSAGSVCLLPDSTVYVLKGDNTWKELGS